MLADVITKSLHIWHHSELVFHKNQTQTPKLLQQFRDKSIEPFVSIYRLLHLCSSMFPCYLNVEASTPRHCCCKEAKILRSRACWEILVYWGYTLKGDCGIPHLFLFLLLNVDADSVILQWRAVSATHPLERIKCSKSTRSWTGTPKTLSSYRLLLEVDDLKSSVIVTEV